MGSTSEIYENEANLVVYVANENARLQSHQRHYQSQPNVVCENVHSIDADHAVVGYDVCPGHGSPSVTVTNFDVASQKAAAVLFDVSDHQNDSRENCAVNGENMRDHSGDFDSCGGENCFAANVGSAVFVSDKTNDPTANFAGQESFVRSESVRSVDSVASGCSSLSSSSVGGSAKSVTNVNFSASLNSSNEGIFNDKQTVAFPSYRVFPCFAKDVSRTFEKSSVSVPFGWKRLLNNGAVIYISPSNTVLNSLEQVNSYLLTDGNCFCGLDCPLYSHTVFNFDPEVGTSSFPVAPGELSKQCSHYRKRNVSGVIPASNSHQSYERASPSSFNNRHSVTNYCNPTVIEKYGFDISDRRKRKKVISSRDPSVPSTSIMIRNNCDISTKENNSVINPVSQFGNGPCDQPLEIRLDMPDQRITASAGPMIRLKPNNQGFANQSGYYGSTPQGEGFNLSNEYFPSYPHNRAASAEQSHVYDSPNEIHGAANSSVYRCGQVKGNPSRQQSCINKNAGQHHRVNYSLASQPHRMACDETDIISSHHRVNSPQHRTCIPSSRMPVVSPTQFQQPSLPQPPQSQHHQLSQTGNFQSLRVVQSHPRGNMMNSPVAVNDQMTTSPMQDDKFADQSHQHACLSQEKMDNSIYRMLPDTSRTYKIQTPHCRMAENANSFCSCYHEDNGRSHRQSSTGSKKSANNCSALVAPNLQNQTNHNLITPAPQIHHLSSQHHGIGLQKPNQSQQLYANHLHHESRPQPQMRLHQSQHLLSQQPQPQRHHHHHRHHHQPQLVHATQNQSSLQNIDMGDSCSNPATSSLGNDVINRGLHYMNANHTIDPTSTRALTMWQQKNINRVAGKNMLQCPEATSSFAESASSYERVPPLHHHVLPSNSWNEEPNRKKYNKSTYKLSTNAGTRKPKVPQQDIRGCQTAAFKGKSNLTNSPIPSFLEDPSGYLAQQTALLNSTISKQTGENSIACYSQVPSKQMCSVANQGQLKYEMKVRNSFDETKNRLLETKTPDSSIQNDACHSQTVFCKNNSRMTSSCKSQGRQDEEITSSTYTDKEHVPSVPRSDSRSPIQAGTVSTSHQSPLQPRINSPSAIVSQDMLPQSPRICGDSDVMKTGTKENSSLTTMPNENDDNVSDLAQRVNTTMSPVTISPEVNGKSGDNDVKNRIDNRNISKEADGKIRGCIGYEGSDNSCGTRINTNNCGNKINNNNTNNIKNNNNNNNNNNHNTNHNHSSSSSYNVSNVYDHCVSSMEFSSCDNGNVNHKHNSCGSNKGTCTSDTCNEDTPLATIAVGDCNRTEDGPSSILNPVSQIEHITKSPLEMVQNVVSSIQIPSQNIETKATVSQNSIQTSHFLLSNNGQLLVATSSNPQSATSQQNLAASSSVVTNASGSMTQMLPTVGVTQQMLSQPTVLVNTLPSGQLVFQPSVMAMDSAGNTLQIPQLTVATANPMVPNQTLTEAGAISVAAAGPFSPRGPASLQSPENSKRKHNNKKRKLSPQHMLQITQSNSPTSNGTTGVVVQPTQTQHSFTQPAPMLQTLILPNKNGQFANTQSLLATTNVLQPVNLVHNIPTIQQFIMPAGLGGMVMNGDGTATILPEAVQLNVLTPVQNATNAAVFGHAGNQSILTASSAAGMVIRTQSNGGQAAINAQLRPQTISTTNGAQFIAAQSPSQFIVNNSPTFNSQLSPIVANVSPNQQIHSFSTSPNTSLASRVTAPQEYIQCVGSNAAGQTLMVPCSVSQSATSPQNTTVVQQNTTIVQQQMTMVSNNQQLPENSSQTSNSNSTSNLGLSQHNIILNDNKQPQNFFITTDNKSTQPAAGFILSPKNCTPDKQASAHFFLNNLNSEKRPSPSFIISNPSEKELCGNFILANSSEKTDARGNLIITANQGTTNFDRQVNRFSKHSVSTQTAGTAATSAATNPQVLQISSTPTLIVAANNTFSQNRHTYSTSPPDTTTHSPVGASGPSPETPSSSFVVESTDDIASPTSSTPIASDFQTHQPMVHCISSSSVVDWAENGSEEKKISIVVDRGSSEMTTGGINVFSPMSSVQSHFQRRSSTDSNENISFIGSSTFDDSTGRK